jgi:hypothetical protein
MTDGSSSPPSRAVACRHFSEYLDRIAQRPMNHFAEVYGLSYGAVLDLIQGRVLPSRAMVILMHAIEADPMWIRDVVKDAKADLAILDAVRGKGGRSGIK